MEDKYIITQHTAIAIALCISIIFIILGVFYSKKFVGLNNYLVANRSVGTFSLSASLIASALGAWVLFGPASAATWGGLGAVIGYALGTAFPLFVLIFLGEKFRKEYSNGKTLIEIIQNRYGNKVFKLILFLSIFYMSIFLIAEVTAVSVLIKYISGTSLWLTALIIIISSLIYTLYGGLRASIFTDNIQFIILVLFLLICFIFIISLNFSNFSFEFISNVKPNLVNFTNITNYTAGLTFFIAVSATNLFHQGNWQRVYAAKDNAVLKKSLIISFLTIIPIVFFMGFCGLIAVSENAEVIPDLAFFSLLLKEKSKLVAIILIFLAISLTVSSIDTLINAIASLIIVDANKIIKYKGDYLYFSKIIIIILSFIAFLVASKGLSVLYLFLLADLLCCAAVISIFYSFYNNTAKENNIYFSIVMGLIGGILLFPTPDTYILKVQKSILIGYIIPIELVPSSISQYLLFYSFVIATFFPLCFLKRR